MARRMGRGIGLVAVALAFGWGCVGFGAWTPAPLCRINCPFFLSGYCHKRGAEGGGALALVYGEGRLRFVAVDLAGWCGGVLVDGVAVGVAVLALR